jgi:hypothetical protein
MWSITTIDCRSFLVEPPSLLYLLPLPVRLFTKAYLNWMMISIHLFPPYSASISSSSVTSSNVSANLLDGMVCVNDTYMLPGRNNLSITVVSDPQRNASTTIQRVGGTTPTPPQAITGTPSAPGVATNNSNPTAITISRTASEMEKQKQLLINPLTGKSLFKSLDNSS